MPEPVLPGQESAWAYPRPAVLVPSVRRLRVMFGGRTIAETERGLRVLETSHPPTYYFPLDDIVPSALRPAASGGTLCEWKGGAQYFDVVSGDVVALQAAWAYPNPTIAFRRLRNHVAFYVSAMGSCWVDDEQAVAQEGGFYGGWITSHVGGPFKGPAGTGMW